MSSLCAWWVGAIRNQDHRTWAASGAGASRTALLGLSCAQGPVCRFQSRHTTARTTLPVSLNDGVTARAQRRCPLLFAATAPTRLANAALFPDCPGHRAHCCVRKGILCIVRASGRGRSGSCIEWQVYACGLCTEWNGRSGDCGDASGAR
jgi:hypothetical protein